MSDSHQIEDLETKVAFQEHTIALLNDVVTDLQKRVELMEKQQRVITSRLKEMGQPQISGQSVDERPPHY